MKYLILAFFHTFAFISFSGCSHDEAPPARLNNYYQDSKRMEQYIKAQGIDKVSLVWSTEGPWSIDLSKSSVTNLDWSVNIPIDKLIINNTAIVDLSPLRVQKKLRWLEANNTSISDLSPISGVPLLETLEIENTRVDDLAPIQNINIVDLNIIGIPCYDLSQIRLNKLRSIRFTLNSSANVKGLDRLRATTNLIINRFMNNAEFWAEYDVIYSNKVQEIKDKSVEEDQ
jgi:internalin A